MFVLGIDPGLTRCGYGVVEGELTGPETFVARTAGVLESEFGLPVEDRVVQLARDLGELFDEWRPAVVVVERVFFQRNAKTAVPVIQVSGLALGIAGLRGASLRQFTAQEVKLALTGYGAASKRQVQEMVAQRCGLADIPRPPDAADALGLAMTYLMVARLEQKFEAAAT